MTVVRLDNQSAGDGGRALLMLVSDLDLELVAGWRSPDGSESGNCFFATTQMMALLIAAGREAGFTMRAGVFHHPDLPAPIVHAWLERGPFVMNVSNLPARPLYVARRKAYHDRNFLGHRFRPIVPPRVKRVLSDHAGDVRAATKRLFAPAMSHIRTLERRRP